MKKKIEDIKGFYIQPSFSKLIVTQAGNLCDFAGTDNLGIWEVESMKNIDLLTGIPFQES